MCRQHLLAAAHDHGLGCTPCSHTPCHGQGPQSRLGHGTLRAQWLLQRWLGSPEGHMAPGLCTGQGGCSCSLCSASALCLAAPGLTVAWCRPVGAGCGGGIWVCGLVGGCECGWLGVWHVAGCMCVVCGWVGVWCMAGCVSGVGEHMGLDTERVGGGCVRLDAERHRRHVVVLCPHCPPVILDGYFASSIY